MRRRIFAAALLAAGCSGGGGGNDGDGETGRVEVEIVVPADAAADPFAGVDTFKVTVRAAGLVVTTGWFGASDALEIEAIPPGSGYTVGLEAFTGGTRAARGRTRPFDFVEGTTTTARMYFAKVRTFNPVRNPSGAPARVGASAAVFSDGTVLVAGGQVGGVAVASADLYFPETDRVLPAGGTMEAPHAFAVTVPLGGDRVLIAGGVNAMGNPTSAADVFEYQAASDAGVWLTIPDMAIARRDAGGGAVADGVAIVGGGESATDNPLASVELFQLAPSPSWTAATAMSSARRGPIAFALSPGNVVLGGGFTGLGGGNAYSDTADRYSWDGSNVTRFNAADLREARERAGIAPLGNYEWAIFGGQEQGGLSNAVEVVRPNGGGTNFTAEDRAPLANDQRRGGGIRLADGRVLFVGGDTATGPVAIPVDRLREFDPGTGQNTAVTPTLGSTSTAFAFELADGTSVVVVDGAILRYSPDVP